MLKSIRKKLQKTNSSPIVVEDVYGSRAIYYPWESTSLEDFISRDFYKPEIDAVKRLVSPGDTVFDVGANVGLFSVLYSNWVGTKGKVLAFEPVPNTYWMMLETLALNRVENVSPQMLALSDKKGTTIMHTFEQKYSAWSSFGSPTFGEHKPNGTVKVKIDTLDDYCASHEIKKIDFLKIDVEGYEKHVLKGSSKLLSSGAVESLSFEISKVPLEASGVAPIDIFKLLGSHGYKTYSFEPETKKFKGPIDNSDAFYENYYASRRDLRRV